jgi:hypothetical protein
LPADCPLCQERVPLEDVAMPAALGEKTS